MNCDNTVNEDYWLCIETANNIFGLTAYCMMGCLLEGPSAQPLPLEYPSEPRILVEKTMVSDLPFFHLDYSFLRKRKLGILHF
jgi:hypothetical protein